MSPDRFSVAGVTGCDANPFGVKPLGIGKAEDRSDVMLDETGIERIPFGARGGGSGEGGALGAGADGAGGNGA